MCILCESTSRAHVITELRTAMVTFGWTCLLVEPDPPTPSLAYTIGLVANGHPELVLSGAPPSVADAVFGEVADAVLDGVVLDPGSIVEAAGHRFAVRDVDGGRLGAGLLAWWPDVFPHCSCHAIPVAVQLVALDDAPWTAGQRRLDEPAATAPRLDRAERRRRDRAERRGHRS